jgi:hypothetical protein
MDILWHVIYFVTMSKFLVLFFIFGILPILISLSVWKGRAWQIIGYAVIAVLALVSVFFGTGIAVGVVRAFGEKGAATITASYGTSTVYNDHDVSAITSCSGRRTAKSSKRASRMTISTSTRRRTR